MLIRKLKEAYGSKQKKEDITLRKVKDVSHFLKEKEKQEKESYKIIMFFKRIEL